MICARTALPFVLLLSTVALACSSSDSPTDTNTGGSSAQGGTNGNTQAGSGGTASTSAGTASNLAGTQSSSAGSTQTGGAGASAGGTATAGSGAVNGGTTTGGAASEGGASGGKAGGSTGGAAGASAGGSGGSSAVASGGCTKAKTLQNGTINISSGGAMRKYILRVPDGYDNNHPYRLVFAFAESGSSAQSVADRNYFTMATLDNKNTIFVAPDAANGMGSWSKTDLDLTDAILMQLEGDLCIDKSRIFATGFSFGGAMSLAIACQRADVFRGVAFFSGADLTGSCTTAPTKPIAYYASQASGDSSGDPMPSSGRIKQAQFAEVNGCMPEPNATNFPAAGQPHTCTEYKGCSAGHPTKYCVFNGPHGWDPKDPGQAMSWNAPEAWKFITQF